MSEAVAGAPRLRTRLLPPLRRARRHLPAIAAASLLLHAAAVWVLLPHVPRRVQPSAPPDFEVEMIDQSQQRQGAPPSAPAAQPPPTPAAPPPAPDLPQAPEADLPPPPPPTPAAPPSPAPPSATPAPPNPAAPAPPTPPAQAARPAPQTTVNIGEDRDQDPLLVTGDNVVPPRADARQNRPPSYPAAAARRHAEGSVGMVIHVTELGIPGWVEITHSSGDPDLDRAAQEAVSLWHFLPAHAGAAAVPFDLPFNINFTLGSAR